jgi:hypothetical protein
MVDMTTGASGQKSLKIPQDVVIKVGILGGRSHVSSRKNRKSVPMAKLIEWLEQGRAIKRMSPKGKSFIITYPPRPIIIPGIEKGLAGIRKAFQQLAAALVEGGDGKKEIAKIGAFTIGKIQEYVDEDLPSIAPNAESTIKRKKTSSGAGGNTPLIDEASLVSAVTYAVDEGE